MLEVDVEVEFDQAHVTAAFSAPPGFTVLYGPSGAGKTTILDCIAGTRRPDRGSVRLDGTQLFEDRRKIDVAPYRRRMSRVFQEGRLFPHLSVRDNLRYGQRANDSAARDLSEVAEVLEIASLLERQPAELSGGERQRVAMGRALLAGPRALLLDEPLAALDAPLRGRIVSFLLQLRQRFDIPFIYVTHAIDEALMLADQVVLLRKGHVERVGGAAEVLAHGVAAPAAQFGAGDSLLEVEVASHREEDGITECHFGNCRLLTLRLDEPSGNRLFLALSARDVILAEGTDEGAPAGLSARNVLRANVLELREQQDRRLASVRFEGAPVEAPTVYVAITAETAREMQLTAGSKVWCIFKSSALRPLGPGGRAHRR